MQHWPCCSLQQTHFQLNARLNESKIDPQQDLMKVSLLGASGPDNRISHPVPALLTAELWLGLVTKRRPGCRIPLTHARLALGRQGLNIKLTMSELRVI